jgi:hypothetical protein
MTEIPKSSKQDIHISLDLKSTTLRYMPIRPKQYQARISPPRWLVENVPGE